MTVQALMFVLDRLYKDPSLFHRYMHDPQEVLVDFDLTPEEIAAVVSGNREALIAIGIDERVAGWIPRPKPSDSREHRGARS